jgi:hypothetical protein
MKTAFNIAPLAPRTLGALLTPASLHHPKLSIPTPVHGLFITKLADFLF